VSYCIALAGEATKFAETLIKPRTVLTATCVSGGQSNNMLESVQPFNNTVKLTIQDLSAHLEKQLVSRLKHSVAFRYNLTNH
jgi:hypothetical protein